MEEQIITSGNINVSIGIDILNYNKKAFTIVELIVVITILAILGTIGFISFSSHLVGTRDTNRISQLSSIHSGLEVYSTHNTLPLPENSVELRASGSLIGYQGYMGKKNLGMIVYSKGGKDPKDEEYFTFYLTKNKKHFQLMAYLEDEGNKHVVRNIFNYTNAADYSKRYPTVIGKKLGILTESGTNLPIQAVPSIVSSGYLDIATTTNNYIANLTDLESISGTGYNLIVLQGLSNLGGNLTTVKGKSCKDIVNNYGRLLDGVYKINPNGSEFKAYCDMNTDDGGWTLVFTCFPYGTSCYNTGAIGGTSPSLFDNDTHKFTDSIIQKLLIDGEKITRTQWWHKSKSYKNGVMNACTDPSGCDVRATGNLLSDKGSQWNLFDDPSKWGSSYPSSGQIFKRKSGSNGTWTSWITSGSTTGCSGAVGGWSNYYEQSCTQSWFASCEGGPALNHRCASSIDRADKLLIWVR